MRDTTTAWMQDHEEGTLPSMTITVGAPWEATLRGMAAGRKFCDWLNCVYSPRRGNEWGNGMAPRRGQFSRAVDRWQADTANVDAPNYPSSAPCGHSRSEFPSNSDDRAR